MKANVRSIRKQRKYSIEFKKRFVADKRTLKVLRWAKQVWHDSRPYYYTTNCLETWGSLIFGDSGDFWDDGILRTLPTVENGGLTGLC